MNKIRSSIIAGIILIFFTLNPVFATSLDKTYEGIKNATDMIDNDRNLNQVRQWISGDINDERNSKVMEKVKIMSRGIDKDNISQFRIKSKRMSSRSWYHDVRSQSKLNLLTLRPISFNRLTVEAELDLRHFGDHQLDQTFAQFLPEPFKMFCFQLSVSYKIDKDISLEIGTKRKFFDRIKVDKEVRDRRANGLILRVKKTDMFFLPIDMTRGHHNDRVPNCFNYIMGAYSEKLHSYNKYELDLFAILRKRADMGNEVFPHRFIGGAKLKYPNRKLWANETGSTLKLNQALRLTCEYQKRHALACTNSNLQWEAKFTNFLSHESKDHPLTKLDVDFYIASKAFKNIFENKKPWPHLMDYYRNIYGFYRPRCGVQVVGSHKLTDKLTLSADVLFFWQIITNDKHLLPSEHNKYLDLCESRWKIAAKYEMSKNISLDGHFETQVGYFWSLETGPFDLELAIEVKQNV